MHVARECTLHQEEIKKLSFVDFQEKDRGCKQCLKAENQALRTEMTKMHFYNQCSACMRNDKKVKEVLASPSRAQDESVTMFCKKHGYIKCECPEEMGLSMAYLQALERVREAASKFKNCKTIYQGYPDGFSCIDVRNYAEKHGNKYSKEFRERILKKENFCDHCVLNEAFSHPALKGRP